MKSVVLLISIDFFIKIFSGSDISPGPVIHDSKEVLIESNTNLCEELLSMLKVRMDLVYAELISKIGCEQALTVMTKSLENNVTPSTSTLPTSFPTTPDISFDNSLKITSSFCTNSSKNESFSMLDEAPQSHYFYETKIDPIDKQKFCKAFQKECTLLRESLPPGVWVKCYNNRLDLLSVMIKGPSKTPYEDGLFVFDMQMSADYPRSPPFCHYISYNSERLNPNLYPEGKVCVSLLGTWIGRGTEAWGPQSSLLQLIVSIQVKCGSFLSYLESTYAVKFLFLVCFN